VQLEVGVKIPAPEGMGVNPALKARSSTAQGEGCAAAKPWVRTTMIKALKGRRSKRAKLRRPFRAYFRIIPDPRSCALGCAAPRFQRWIC
jgi:hypothetical protein